MNTYLILKNKHKDKNCIILGAGTSLFFAGKNEKFNNLLKNNIVISVNSSILLYNNCDYWISCDPLCMRWSYFNKVKVNSKIQVVRSSWEKYKDKLKDFLFFEPRPTSEDIINYDDIGLCYCSSVPASIDLAIFMGCKNIYIFGLDHYDIEGKSHFWQFYLKEEQPFPTPLSVRDSYKKQEKIFDINNQSFRALKKYAELNSCNIYNCNLNSKVDIFEKIDY